MKVLLVHNDYGKYSGEEAVVDRMSVMLADRGYEVAQLRMSTAGSRETFMGKMHGFVAGLYSASGVCAMRETLQREKPDVVNIHNLYPFISPAALFECKKAGVPVVMTIHNFRLICPTGLFMRNGEPCERCLSKGNEWGCVKYNCEHSLMKSIGYAARNAVARITGAYAECVDRFACITEFQRRKLIAAGFDPEKIIVIPNAIDSPKNKGTLAGRYVAYSGRLSREKGVDLIIEVARRHPEIPFRFAGAVRDAAIVDDLPGNVSLAGYLSGTELDDFYKNANFFVMASRWYEGFPMTILEAARYGKSTVGPDHGGFTEIIGKGEQAIGKLFKPGDVDDLERQVVELWNTPEDVVRLGSSAFEKLQSRYSVEVISRQWQQLFNHIIGRK
ncbi:glycosyltransferase family 4 protein [uncultured Alistipes sp.]|uniref:glycosyltransferase family 4 protein n=1 Tax=uncultured Alistipes sp. TaxID=538949 RepID=UPI002628B564|nr:glycosyltransferase family 4 protein [uncultured Alistipes sp.]